MDVQKMVTQEVIKLINQVDLVADQFRNIKTSAEKIQRRADKIQEIEGTSVASIEDNK